MKCVTWVSAVVRRESPRQNVSKRPKGSSSAAAANRSTGIGLADQFPGGPRATDGVVIWSGSFGTKGTATAPFNLGRTATHEIGHFLLHKGHEVIVDKLQWIKDTASPAGVA